LYAYSTTLPYNIQALTFGGRRHAQRATAARQLHFARTFSPWTAPITERPLPIPDAAASIASHTISPRKQTPCAVCVLLCYTRTRCARGADAVPDASGGLLRLVAYLYRVNNATFLRPVPDSYATTALLRAAIHKLPRDGSRTSDTAACSDWTTFCRDAEQQAYLLYLRPVSGRPWRCAGMTHTAHLCNTIMVGSLFIWTFICKIPLPFIYILLSPPPPWFLPHATPASTTCL